MQKQLVHRFGVFMGLIFLASVSHGAQDVKSKNQAYLKSARERIAGKENLPADSVFQNIQIFKGMPADRLLKVMEFGFTPALGAECTFCHVENNWASEDKKQKQTARKMWDMAANIRGQLKEIVGDKAVVNCYTCHRGAAIPAINP